MLSPTSRPLRSASFLSLCFRLFCGHLYSDGLTPDTLISGSCFKIRVPAVITERKSGTTEIVETRICQLA